ncbi:MAG: hypothetical protein S4CHLAM81_09100 [Chlamydiales bacterium]|nr:hypothetical protein [Chlamydiales bacterium]MCH9635689.1 hypothetical protein [Chlamydiales bacterium]
MLILFYLLGNLHCLGMCGPIVAFLGRHKYRNFYFLGRLTSFSLTGLISSQLGILLTALFKQLHLTALFSFLVGGVILLFGLFSLLQLAYPGQQLLAKAGGSLSIKMSQQLTKDSPWPLFTFGLCTILLPCGQTIVAFSAMALLPHPWMGLLHGFLFATLTSPSLFLAMQGFRKLNYRKWMGIAMLIVGVIAILRGFADLEMIPHLGKFHLVLY